MQTQTTVIYHSGDFDGLFCREIARHFITSEVLTLIGWDYKDPKIPFPATGMVYVLDLNPELFLDFPGIDVAKERVIWIDHHKTAIDKWGTYLPGYRIDGVAASRLTWQWFSLAPQTPGLPDKQEFIDRKVTEPLAVRLAGEYDIWDHRGDGDLELQFGLRCEGDQGPMWEELLKDNQSYVKQLIIQGKVAMNYTAFIAGQSINAAGFLVQWQGLKFLALNSVVPFQVNSLTFASRDVPETGHDALMAFCWNGKSWTFSLYHAAHRKDLDLSAIAVKFGGGGHKGACGFRTAQIPFPLYAV